ncbi:MAG TPA: mechanosensitive ion channel protein [Nitrospira sp.]|jgi:small-conductance mechanosensitive channel|nr:mechanosensitive ion channel protein [Nitrospira sp.]
MPVLDLLVRGDVIDPATLIGAAFYAFLFILVAWFLARLVRAGVRRVAHLLNDQAACTLLTRLGQVVVYSLAVLLYFNAIPQLHSVGTALLASAGVASILFGLAAQTTLSNLVSGFALLLYQPFEVGDRVQLSAPTGLETGLIEEMTMGYILVRTSDDRQIVVPNNVASQQIVVKLRAA